MTENSGAFQLNASSSPSSSPKNQQTIISNQHDGHSIHLQQQHNTANIKAEPDYEYVDESGNTIVAHNYSRNHSGNDDEQQDIGNVSEHNSGSLYHMPTTGSGGGGGGGGGGGENPRRGIINNNTIQQQQQSSVSPSQHSGPHPRNQPHVLRSGSPAAWNQSTQNQQTSGDQQNAGQQIPPNSFGMLRHENDILYISENCIEIGRNSSTSSVHFHVAKNSFVSRKHFQIVYDPQTGDFYLICLSKNGIFVDDVFQRRSTEAVKLPKSCTFRFPSTEIRIAFESFSDKIQNNLKTVENSNVIYSPLKITIPKTEQKSPYPSPTGTISAANSCPTSPRQGFQDYHGYNYNNNNNFQNEMFQPPSTSTYNEHEKPPYSYAQLIVQSISASPDKQLTLSGIYSFISKHYPYYRKEANKGWQNSIRHNLSLNRYFIKVARSQDEPGKGSFWRIDPNSEAKLIDQSYKKRRQRGSQCFRPPYGMPRSAPVSPSHIDNSRENSPLHDIVLQSAPGSPGVSYQNNHGENNHGGSEEASNYTTHNTVPQSYNSHSQYSSTAYYSAANMSSSSSSVNTSATITSSASGPIGPLKRHQPSSGGAIISTHANMYDDVNDYGTGADSDECETVKRPKYASELNQ